MGLSKRKRFEILKRDGFQCRYCGSCPPDVALEVDHVKPKSKGGCDDPSNLVTACGACNRGKSNIEGVEVTEIAVLPEEEEELVRLIVDQVNNNVRSAAARCETGSERAFLLEVLGSDSFVAFAPYGPAYGAFSQRGILSRAIATWVGCADTLLFQHFPALGGAVPLAVVSYKTNAVRVAIQVAHLPSSAGIVQRLYQDGWHVLRFSADADDTYEQIVELESLLYSLVPLGGYC